MRRIVQELERMSTDLTFRTHVVSQRDCRSKHLAQSSSPCGNVACCSSSRHEYTFGKETKIAPDSSVPAAWASTLPEESRNESSTDLMSFGCSRSEHPSPSRTGNRGSFQTNSRTPI